MADQIRIRDAGGNWVVRAGGAVIGESAAALEVTHGDRDPVIYFPRDGIAMAFLEPSTTRVKDPHLGEARHFSIQTKSVLIADAVWSFETPKPGYEKLAGHLAFDTTKATVEEI
ncbi:MAG: DUF427 domain-containing protein [Rhodobacteraceae bacterium]|nr:DUF427 domain-containing protein [Paracoccaceae bacterium]